MKAVGELSLEVEVKDFNLKTDMKFISCKDLEYDFIFGTDILKQIKINILLSNEEIVINDRAMKIRDCYENECDKLLIEKTSYQLNYNIIRNTKEFLEKFEYFKNTNPKLGLIKNAELKLELKDNTVVCSSPYPVEHIFLKSMKDEIEDLLRKGVIVHSESSYASPSFVIPKTSPEVRLIIDYRKLNKALVRSAYPFPDLRDKLEGIEGARFFSTVDLNQGYYQMSIRKEDRHLTAFVTSFGHYEFTRVPFGLANAPQEFVRTMERIFVGCDFVRCLLMTF